MSEDTISVRIASDKRTALEAIAARTDRDLSLVIDEALDAYLELHAWHVRHIQEGMRQADSGEFAPEAEVRAALEAIADIDRIYDFIAASNPRAAKAIVDD